MRSQATQPGYPCQQCDTETTNNVIEEEEEQDEQSQAEHSDTENNGDEYDDYSLNFNGLVKDATDGLVCLF